MSIICTLLNDGLLAKSDTVVVFNGSVSLVRQFDLTATESVYLIMLELLLEAIGCLVKPCGLDEGSFSINQIDVHDGALTTIVLPGAHIALLHDARFDDPVG